MTDSADMQGRTREEDADRLGGARSELARLRHRAIMFASMRTGLNAANLTMHAREVEAMQDCAAEYAVRWNAGETITADMDQLWQHVHDVAAQIEAEVTNA